MKTTTITVQNLKCGGCAKTISTKLTEVKNLSNIKVVIDDSKISFDYIDDSDFENAKNKLASLGYPLEGDNNNTFSKAKSFVSCATGKMSK